MGRVSLVWVAFSDTSCGVVGYLLFVYKGVVPGTGAPVFSARGGGGVIFPTEVWASVCCPCRVVTGGFPSVRVELCGLHCAPLGSATVAATLIGAYSPVCAE
jgi:hypothetical protein